MEGIFVPASLNTADAVLGLADSLAKLLEPKERAKIADDIRAHHALNMIETKKHADALALIKQHQGILDETNRVSTKNKADKEALEQKEKDDNAWIEAEKKKIADKWSDVNTAAQTAKALHTKAEGMINSVAKREEDLRKGRIQLDVDVKKNEQRTKDLDTEYATVEEIKRQHTEMLEGVKSTQAKIASLVIK